jgi:hypothetical protein
MMYPRPGVLASLNLGSLDNFLINSSRVIPLLTVVLLLGADEFCPLFDFRVISLCALLDSIICRAVHVDQLDEISLMYTAHKPPSPNTGGRTAPAKQQVRRLCLSAGLIGALPSRRRAARVSVE